MSNPLGPPPEEGAWIFVSHSHRDLHLVRRVRDALEAKGHQPLLFFLKCLDDDAEIDGLIRREIEVRQFFLLCDSLNARESRWVQQEVALISELDGKVSLSLEMEGDWETQLAAIDELSRRATVFFSYASRSRASTQMAVEIAKALRAKDYRIYFDVESLGPGASWGEQVAAALDDAMDQGFLLLLLSPEAFAADEVGMEVEYAVTRRAGSGRSSNVVALIVSERERTLSLLGSSTLGRTLGQITPLDFTSGEFNDNMEKLLRILAR
jgi:hypothetical protein